MRLGVVYGNGCTCDKCHKVLIPSEAIKIKALKLNPENSTGMYNTLGKADLCEKCYQELITPFLKKPRKINKKENSNANT